MITQEEFTALLQRYLDGQCQPGEQQLVEQWSAQLGQPENLVLRPDLHEEVRVAMWQRIVQLTADEAAAQTPTTRVIGRPLAFWRPARRWAAAAFVALGLGLGWWLPQHRPRGLASATTPQWVLRTNTSRRAQTMQLADGSHVTLATGSTLKYQAGLAGQRREVYLVGQAFFKVAKNPLRPFLVYTDKVVATVLGTSFLVTAYAGQEPKVAVREGRVAVQAREGAVLTATPAQPVASGIVLLPNQQVRYCTATHELNKTLVDNPVVVVPQTFAFKKRPVAEVLAALSKAYGVNIVYDPAKLQNCTVTIALGDEPLFEQLTLLCKVLDAKYKIANSAQIIFESNHCQASE